MTVEVDDAETGGRAGEGDAEAISPCATSADKPAVDSLRVGPPQARGSYDRPSELPMSASDADDEERCERCSPPAALIGRAGVAVVSPSGKVGCEWSEGSGQITNHGQQRTKRTSPKDGPLRRIADLAGALPTMKLLLASGEVASSGCAECERGNSARGESLGWYAARAGETESGDSTIRSEMGVIERREASAEGGRAGKRSVRLRGTD